LKIEIGENLIYSYLRHVEGCRIAQTNWRTSGKWAITDYDKEQAKFLFNKIKQSPSFINVFKSNSFEQLIKQAEIDVLGLNVTESSIFGIDVAFHFAGLNYGDPEETALIVMKKIFRTIFVMQSYFKEFNKFNSYFVTPKTNRATKTPIDNLLKEAKEIINDDSISIEFITNEDFYTYIIESLKKFNADENDTAELFSRAIKLLQLDPRKPTTVEPQRLTPQSTIGNVVIDKRTQEGMKIGQFVKFYMRKLFEENLLSDQEITNLQSKEYSKKVFNQNFEVLRNISQGTTDKLGRNRYYTNEVFFKNYHLTSQWFEYNWEPFLKWLNSIKGALKN